MGGEDREVGEDVLTAEMMRVRVRRKEERSTLSVSHVQASGEAKARRVEPQRGWIHAVDERARGNITPHGRTPPRLDWPARERRRERRGSRGRRETRGRGERGETETPSPLARLSLTIPPGMLSQSIELEGPFSRHPPLTRRHAGVAKALGKGSRLASRQGPSPRAAPLAFQRPTEEVELREEERWSLARPAAAPPRLLPTLLRCPSTSENGAAESEKQRASSSAGEREKERGGESTRWPRRPEGRATPPAGRRRVAQPLLSCAAALQPGRDGHDMRARAGRCGRPHRHTAHEGESRRGEKKRGAKSGRSKGGGVGPEAERDGDEGGWWDRGVVR